MKQETRLALCLSFAQAAWGVEYTYKTIADNSPGSPYRRLETVLTINNRGQIAFTATTRDGRQSVFFGGVDETTRSIFTGTEEIPEPFVTSLNDSGAVAFTSAGSIYTVREGSAPTRIAQGTIEDPIGQLTFPTINNSGAVAWSTRTRIWLASPGSAPRVLLNDTDLPRRFATVTPTVAGAYINSSGTVSFLAYSVNEPNGCSCAHFLKGAGAPTRVAAATLSPFTRPVNDNGTVALIGDYSGKYGVFLARNGTVTPAFELNDFSVSQFDIGLNNQDAVAVIAADGRRSAILTGPDFLRDRVAGTNDPLFGSTLLTVHDPPFPGRMLNNSGQVVFFYTLANGLQGIAIASPSRPAASGLPRISASGAVNAASFSANTPASPGSIVSLFGSDLTDRLRIADSAILPTNIGDTRVTVDGVPAPLYFVAPGQINFQVPFRVGVTSAEVRVSTPAGQSEAVRIAVSAQSPAIYTLNQLGNGQAVVVFANSTRLVAGTGVTTDSRPGRAGELVTIYANGLGTVDPPVEDGVNSCSRGVCASDFSNLTLRHVVTRPTVEIGGVRVPDSDILFAGLAPQSVGLYQINLRLPSGLRAGAAPVVITQGANRSPDNVWIVVE